MEVKDMAIFNNKLSDDDLDVVSGGGIFDSSGLSTDDNENKKDPWEVIDDSDGKVLARCKTQNEALYVAGQKKVNSVEYNWNQVQQLRG